MPLIRPKASVHFADVQGDGTLLDMERGQYVRLNPTATCLWHVLVRAGTLDEAIPALQARLDADEATLRRATSDFIQQVRAAGLAEPPDRGPAAVPA